MRYDTPIYFQKVIQGEYNPTTGDYGEDTTKETCAMASVIDTRTETMRVVYGSIKQGSKTIHIQNHYDESYDLIRINDKIYQTDYSRKLRNKQSFIVHEVQNG
ncbi:hypothetical protein DWX89_03125 [Coprobacillus sp. AF21-8LB]|jgi:hypothetical protein|nr:hypothetical protein DWX89_03125 [Coprobacillus sp. AF21-8LB]DAY70767.1 MAG TPA: head closure knob [Caudoviricetes sp.]